MMKTIVVISPDIVTVNIAERILSPFYQTVAFRNAMGALDYIYNSLPNLVIMDLSLGDKSIISVLKNNLKDDPLFQQMPVLAIFRAQPQTPNWDELFVEDFIWRHNMEDELLLRTNLSVIRSERIVEINPLTRLPGNISINRQIESRLLKGDTFTLAYADLDNFKPFNDKYGFSRGDDVIKATGRIILNVVKNRQPINSFIGHIGGDDFIFITDPDVVEDIASEIVKNFDDIMPTFYDPKDREAGYIQSVDRQNVLRTFPMVSLSIGITHTGVRQFSHYGEVVESASQMKSFAKQQAGSVYHLDRRQQVPS